MKGAKPRAETIGSGAFFIFVAEDAVHHGRATADRGHDDVPVDRLSDVGGVVAYRVADLLDGDAVAADGATWVEDDLAFFQPDRSSLTGPPSAVRDG
jgi:hypothetical protein